MRRTRLRAEVPHTTPSAAYAQLIDFTRFPALSADVRSVTVHPGTEPGATRITTWKVDFRQGLLSWTEREDLDRTGLSVEFAQVDGDFADLHGSWRVEPAGTASEITFDVVYDFGIESLAGAMDPIAERLLLRVVGDILGGLFDGAVISRDPDPEAMPGASAT